MTYPDHAVRAAIADRFVALKLDQQDPAVRPLNILWLPTVLVLDRRGVEHYRNVNAVPPEDFLDVLDLGEAHARLKGGQSALADERMREALARRSDSPLRPELLYWSGITAYFANRRDGQARDRQWAVLEREYPDSIWAHRIPKRVR